MRTKGKKPRTDGYYVVGPGPLGLKDGQGAYIENIVPVGQFAIVFDDEGEARLHSTITYVSYEQAKLMADWMNESLD